MRARLTASAMLVAGVVGLSACTTAASTMSSRPAKDARGATASRPVHRHRVARLPAVVVPPKHTTLLATIRVPTPDYTAPVTKKAIKPIGLIPTRWHSSTVTLPVIAQRPGWLDVRLPQRPNGQTAWIRSTMPRLSYTGYAITVNVATMHLQLYLRGKLIMSAPAGIGAPWDPTPTGHFFVAYFAQPPDPGYGPFVIVTSAHSNSITDWESSGDAEIGIHGALGMDAAIGTTGARISHGCVRLHLVDQQKLRAVPLGAPVTIIS